MPILRVEEGLGDPVALATWHEALSSALSVDVPHDLLALWLYPSRGGSVLLGPEALAQDDLSVPVPSPQIDETQLAFLEEIVRDAGYRSVATVPIRFGRRDVGLMLVGDLQPSRYDATALVTLRLVTHRLAPLFGRLARQWDAAGATSRQLERIAALLDIVGQAAGDAATPDRFIVALSRGLERLLPHDHLELLLADSPATRFFRLGEHSGGPTWSDPSLVVGRQDLDVEQLFGPHDRLLLPDSYREPRWPRGYLTLADPPGAEPRSIVGARIAGPKGLSAFLLAGSVGPDLYEEEDAALLVRLSALITAQVALFAWAGEAERRPAPAGEAGCGLLVGEAAEVLAQCSDMGEAMSRVAELAGRLIPFDVIRYAIRLREGDRVVLLEPGERRPLPDLPLVPVAGTSLAQVLSGALASAFALVEGEARLIVPLRVGARVHGALVLTGAPPAVLREVHVHAAQRLADVVAPHLELLRRAALLPPPYMPGWKKVK
ncbi:MAG: hypothetical protein ACJ8DC_05800 [Gemmatimonadales bacterium]